MYVSAELKAYNLKVREYQQGQDKLKEAIINALKAVKSGKNAVAELEALSKQADQLPAPPPEPGSETPPTEGEATPEPTPYPAPQPAPTPAGTPAVPPAKAAPKK